MTPQESDSDDFATPIYLNVVATLDNYSGPGESA